MLRPRKSARSPGADRGAPWAAGGAEMEVFMAFILQLQSFSILFNGAANETFATAEASAEDPALARSRSTGQQTDLREHRPLLSAIKWDYSS